jgi:CubicO group peptidase (beta-lactamase class C family)
VAACSTSATPPRAPTTATAVSTPAIAPASATPASLQGFADADPGYGFVDPERRHRLLVAFPAIDAALTAEMKAMRLPGFALGVVIDGDLAYSRGFGVTDLETQARPDADTIYRIGSITKSFTSLALLAQRDDGKLGLDDLLARWIPEARGLVYPTRDAPPITLRQLANHTSGLPRLGAFDVDAEPSQATIVASLPGTALEFTPGTDWRYSNLGFSLLGLVVERAAGAPFHDVVRRRIFQPLGMTSSFWTLDEVPADRLATTYDGPLDHLTRTKPVRRGAAGGSGAIYSTVRDLARYAALQLSAYPARNDPDTGPIRRATLREAHGTGVQASSWAGLAAAPRPGDATIAYNTSTYGFGWIKEQNCDFDDLVWHNGAIDSYRSELQLLPSRGVGVIILTNFPVETGRLARRAVAELLRTGALAPRVPRPSPALLAAADRLLAVQNHWDPAAYKAMLDPARADLTAVEQHELATYHALHGTCGAATPIAVRSPTAATLRATCDRGSFELALSIAAGSDRITGFAGTSRGVAAPARLAEQAAAIASLISRWDDAVFQRHLARTRRPPADAQAYFADLRATYGACHVLGAVHEGLDWHMELACDRASPLALRLTLRDHDPTALEDYNVVFRGPGCPRRT